MSKPVELGYFTLMVKDVDRAKIFYSALFGWEFHDRHVGNTKLPLGVSSGGPADVSFVYFRVEDIERYVGQVKALGGSVRERNKSDSGPNAVCVDDQGTVFSLWQAAPGYA